MARRPRTDSPDEQVRNLVDAALGLPDLPAHAFVRPGDRPFLAGILRARARDEWGDSDLVVACQLARVQADIERESRLLEEESGVVQSKRQTAAGTAKSTPITNPRIAGLDMLTRRQLALLRALRMAGTAAGDPRDEMPRRLASKAAAEVAAELEDGDGLLATP